MKQFTPHSPNRVDGSHSLIARFLVGLALVAAFPLTLWVLADPAAALLTVAAVAIASLLLVGVRSDVEERDSQ